MKLPVAQPDTDPWYAEGLRFSCTQCGNCCTGGPGYVWISTTEIDRLAEHLKLSRQETIERYCRRLGGRYSLNERRDARGSYDCCFLEEHKVKEAGPGGRQVTVTRRICAIYPVRPLQCRTWPFWDGNLASQANWNHAAERCPGMGRGRRFDRRQIDALNRARDWPEEPPNSK